MPKPNTGEAIVPYKLDPDFLPRPAQIVAPGPGYDLSPQEREVVRRLATIFSKNSSLSLEMLAQRLARGINLSSNQESLLAGLINLSAAKRVQRLGLCWQEDYTREPPSMQEFLDNDYYLGASLRRSSSNEGLWPGWHQWLIEKADRESFLHNLVLSGGIGIGKSMVMVTLILYRLCLCASLRDPYLFFGLSLGSPINFLLLSISQDTLRSTAWSTALRLLAASPFFRERCAYNPRQMHAGLEVQLRIDTGCGSQVQLTLSGGSKGQHHLGRNVLAVALDEGNFRLEKEPQQYAAELFCDLRARMISRFQRLGTFMPGLSVVASSAGEESSFTEQLINQIEKDNDPYGQLLVRQAIYRIKPGLKLRSWWFRVWYGLPNVEPAISPGCYNANGEPIPAPADCPSELAKLHEPLPAGARWELVPGDYYDQFRRAPRKHLQQLSGISLGGSHRLFPTLADVHTCIELAVKDGVRAPTRAAVLSVSDEDTSPLWDALSHGGFVERAGSNSYRPVRHPQRLRYAHLDLAITGLAGLAVCHLVEPAVSLHKDNELGGARLIVEYDFILTIAPGKTRPICFQKILDFLLWLRNICGFRFGLVTADSFQSQHMLQSLDSKGIATAVQSVDRDKKAYQAWQAGFQEHCVRLYEQAQLLKEAAALIELDSKIDHPPGGSKDTTDAAAAAYLSAITSDEIRTLGVPKDPPVVMGISPAGNASPEDPFGFYSRIKPLPTRVFVMS